MRKIDKRKLLMLCALLCLSCDASANAGIPMIIVIMPALVVTIIPIVIIESIYLSKKLILHFRKSVKTTIISNFVSSVVGIPLTWLLLLAIQMLAGGGRAFGLDSLFHKILSVTLQAPWLIPYETEPSWMAPIASLFLLIPFFFVSWWSECVVVKRLLKDAAKENIKIAIRNANIITYSLLAIFPIVLLICSSES